MLIIYDSLTGQGARFAKRLGYETVSILDYEGQGQDLFLITRNYDFGQVTLETSDFLEDYAEKLVGLAVSGNRNWGENYGAAGDKIADQYQKELVLKFEGSGFSHDIKFVQEWIENYIKEQEQQ